MITFDDGYYNNYIYAYPLLKQRGMRAVVSIIGSQTALFTDNGEENAYWVAFGGLERLREMQDVFEVQNHSWNLHEYGERRGCLRRRGEDETRYETLLREDTEQTQTLITDAGLPGADLLCLSVRRVLQRERNAAQKHGLPVYARVRGARQYRYTQSGLPV